MNARGMALFQTADPTRSFNGRRSRQRGGGLRRLYFGKLDPARAMLIIRQSDLDSGLWGEDDDELVSRARSDGSL